MEFILLHYRSCSKDANALIECGISFHNSSNLGILIMLIPWNIWHYGKTTEIKDSSERSKTCIRLEFRHMELSDKQIDINKKEILRLLVSTQREGVERVIDYMYSSGFFTIPSSIDRHHCWNGGLAEHSLNVCKIALSKGEGSLPKDSTIVRRKSKLNAI